MTIVIDIVDKWQVRCPAPHPLPQPDQSGIAAGQRPRRETRNLKRVSSMKPIQSIKAIQYRTVGINPVTIMLPRLRICRELAVRWARA